jgi:6-phosphogluconolactonase
MIGAIQVFPTGDDVATHVADWLIARVAAAPGPFRLALSGGSTPKKLFALLAAPGRAAQMPWSKLHLFWGDERHVPPDSPDSNYGEARRILLDRVPLPAAQIHPMPTAGTPDADAAAYATLLQRTYGAAVLDPARPLFDVNFLGLGEDGHTASLIPGQPVLAERTAWVAAVGQGRPEVRITLTYPVLESARTVAFLVTGAAKADILRRLRADTADVPAAKLRPVGDTVWFIDAAAGEEAKAGPGALPLDPAGA